MKDRTILWIFLAFTLGFTLPVCSCVGTGLLTMTLMGRLAEPGERTAVTGDAVGIIRLDGVIHSAPEEYAFAWGITPEHTARLLKQAAVNPNIKAVVVHINSSGGSVVASDRIYRMLLDFEKPVVIWMDEMAASGGYYIACGGDYIFAHPSTLTGSIGVISRFLRVQELMDKVGVEAEVIASGPGKDIGSPFREMTDEERALWKGIINETYDGFVEVVAQARHLPLEKVRELADGRIYTGRQALEAGLVDAVGTLDDAIAKAAELGGITGKPEVIELKSEPGLLEMLYGFQARTPALEELLKLGEVPSLEFRIR